MNNRYAIGVDIGGSHVCCSVVDMQNMTLVPGSEAQRQVNNRAEASVILTAWCDAVGESISRSSVRPGAAGFAFPGPFDYDRGICKINGVDKFERIFGLDVRCCLLDRLKEYGVEEVRFVNDASAFALGEYTGGAGRDSRRMIALTLGTGLGSGFIADGQLITSGPQVPANGWVYCLPFGETIADDSFSTRWFCRRYEQLTGQSVNGAREIADRIGESREARQIFEEYAQRLGRFAASVCEPFSPDTLVLGGNIARAYSIFGENLIKTLQLLGCRVEVKPTLLHDKAAMIGAASLFYEHTPKDN